MARLFDRPLSSWVRERLRRAELASSRRVGSHSKRQLRGQQTHWLRARWRLALMAMAFAGLVALAIRALVWKPLAPYLVGATLASACWWTYATMLETGGFVSRRMGVYAEEWTLSELRPLRKRGWLIVNHVMTQRTDVDHALLGPGGFIALETKFRSDWTTADQYFDRIARQAKKSAWDLQARLGPRSPTVQPVVVMWGNHVRRHFVQAFDRDGVTFCPGHLLRAHIESMPQAISVYDVEKAFAHLDRYLQRRDARELADAGEVPRTMLQAFDQALAVAASALLSTLAVVAPATIRPHGMWSFVVAAMLILTAVLARRRRTTSVLIQRLTTSVLATCAGLICFVPAATLFFNARWR